MTAWYRRYKAEALGKSLGLEELWVAFLIGLKEMGCVKRVVSRYTRVNAAASFVRVQGIRQGHLPIIVGYAKNIKTEDHPTDSDGDYQDAKDVAKRHDAKLAT